MGEGAGGRGGDAPAELGSQRNQMPGNQLASPAGYLKWVPGRHSSAGNYWPHQLQDGSPVKVESRGQDHIPFLRSSISRQPITLMDWHPGRCFREQVTISIGYPADSEPESR